MIRNSKKFDDFTNWLKHKKCYKNDNIIKTSKAGNEQKQKSS